MEPRMTKTLMERVVRSERKKRTTAKIVRKQVNVRADGNIRETEESIKGGEVRHTKLLKKCKRDRSIYSMCWGEGVCFMDFKSEPCGHCICCNSAGQCKWPPKQAEQTPSSCETQSETCSRIPPVPPALPGPGPRLECKKLRPRY